MGHLGLLLDMSEFKVPNLLDRRVESGDWRVKSGEWGGSELNLDCTYYVAHVSVKNISIKKKKKRQMPYRSGVWRKKHSAPWTGGGRHSDL